MIPVLTLEQGGGYQLIKTCTYNQCDDIVTFQGNVIGLASFPGPHPAIRYLQHRKGITIQQATKS